MFLSIYCEGWGEVTDDWGGLSTSDLHDMAFVVLPAGWSTHDADDVPPWRATIRPGRGPAGSAGAVAMYVYSGLNGSSSSRLVDPGSVQMLRNFAMTGHRQD